MDTKNRKTEVVSKTNDTLAPVDGAAESASPVTVAPAVTPPPEHARAMKKLRFVFGMSLTGVGIALILSVAAGAVQAFGVNGRLSLPAVGLCMIVGVMLLGGGFGVMATSAATFENDEFERLMADNSPRRTSSSA